MDWFHIKNNIPNNGQVVLGHDADIGQVSIFTYREGRWHYRDEDHFWGTDITWWAPLPEPPRRKVKSERGTPEYLVLRWDEELDTYVVAKRFRTATRARAFATTTIKIEHPPFVAQRLSE